MPRQEVHTRAENVAERIAGDGAKAVGLVAAATKPVYDGYAEFNQLP